MDDFDKDRCDIIIGRYLLTVLGLNIYFSRYIIEVVDEPLKGSTSPLIYLGVYYYKYLNMGEVTPEKYFKNVYVEKLFDL